MFYLQRISNKKKGYGGHEKLQIELNKPILTIGRNAEADIKCMSMVCSRRQGSIFVNDDGTIDIEATETTNGIYVHKNKITERTRLKINDVIGFGCVVNTVTLADNNYDIFSLQKKENVTILDDGVICLDDDDDYDNNENLVQAIKTERSSSKNLPESASPVVTVAPRSVKSEFPQDNDGFKLPNPVDIYVPDEEVLESQSLIHMAIKQEEEELFDESFSFNDDGDDEEVNQQPLTQIDIDVSDEEDCLVLGHFSQQLNIDGVYKRTVKTEIKDEVLSDSDSLDIDDFFEEIYAPDYENIADPIPGPSIAETSVAFTQEIESKLAAIMPEEGVADEMDFEEEMNTENLAALLEDTIPLPTSSPLHAEQATPTQAISPDVTAKKQSNSDYQSPRVLKRRHSLSSIESTPSKTQKSSPNKIHQIWSLSTEKLTSPSDLQTAQPTCLTTPPMPKTPGATTQNLTPFARPANRVQYVQEQAELRAEDDIPCTPLTACVTQLKAKMTVKRPPELIDAPPMPKRRGRSKSVSIEPIKVQRPKKDILQLIPKPTTPRPIHKQVEVNDGPKKKPPVVCKTTKNRGLFFIETPIALQPVHKRPVPKKETVALSGPKPILKTSHFKRKRKLTLKFSPTHEVREFEKLFDGILRDEPHWVSKQVTNFGVDHAMLPTIETSKPKTVPVAIVAPQKPTDPRLANRVPVTVIPGNFETNIKSHMDRLLIDMLKWNCAWLDGPEEQSQLMPVSKLRPILHSYTCFKDYSETVTRLMILEIWSGIHRAYRLHFSPELPRSEEKIVGELINVKDRKFPTHERLSFDCEFMDSQIKYRKPDALFVCLENGCNKIFGYVSAYSRDLRARPVKVVLTIQIAKTESSHAIANHSLKRIQIRFITSVQTDLKTMQALLSAEHLPLMKFVLNPMLMVDASDKNEKALLDQPVKSKLNSNQNSVIMDIYHQCAIAKPGVTLVEGPPGSGKSIVIANLVEQLCLGPETASKNLKILICTQSNGAADNIAVKLLSKKTKGLELKLLRYGIEEKIGFEAKPVSLKQFLVSEFSKYIEKRPAIKSVFDRKKLLDAEIEKLRTQKNPSEQQHDQMCNLETLLVDIEAQVKMHEKSVWAKAETYTPFYIQSSNVIVSTLGFVHHLKRFVPEFDICIIDEATQCTEAATLIPFQFNIKHLVLIGDTKQLPATVFSKIAREYNLHRSLFTRIQELFEKTKHKVVKTLDTQYRMHPEIVKFPNAFFYRNRMLTEVTAIPDFKLIPYAVFGLECWQTSTQTMYNVYNLNEVLFVTRLLKQMRELADPKRFSYGVITPYDRHRKEIVKQLQIQKITGVTVNTVDSFQGQERDIIIISTAKTDGIGFLDDPNRLNVALTRARHCLVVCGNFHELSKVRIWIKLLTDATERKVFFPVDEDVERPVDKLLK